jgi:hypothetical protein
MIAKALRQIGRFIRHIRVEELAPIAHGLAQGVVLTENVPQFAEPVVLVRWLGIRFVFADDHRFAFGHRWPHVSRRRALRGGLGDGTILGGSRLPDAFHLATYDHFIEPTQQGPAGGFLAELLEQSVDADAVGGIADGTIQFLVHGWHDNGTRMARFNAFLA